MLLVTLVHPFWLYLSSILYHRLSRPFSITVSLVHSLSLSLSSILYHCLSHSFTRLIICFIVLAFPYLCAYICCTFQAASSKTLVKIPGRQQLEHQHKRTCTPSVQPVAVGIIFTKASMVKHGQSLFRNAPRHKTRLPPKR